MAARLSPLRMLLVAAVALCGTVVFQVARKRISVAPPLPALLGLGLGTYAYLASDLIVAWAAIAVAVGGVTLPAFLYTRARRAAGRGDLAAAARWSARHAAIRRDRRSRLLARYWAAARDFHDGDAAPAATLDQALVADDSPFSRGLREALLAIRRDWPALRHAQSDDIRARALCQLGEVEAGIEACGKVWRRGLGWPGVRRAQEASLTAVAFAGRTGATEALTRLLRMPPAVAALWRMVSRFAAGDADGAHAAAATIDDAPAPVLRARDAYLADPPRQVELGPSAQDVVARAEAEILAGEALRLRAPWRDPGTAALLILLGSVFAFQVVRGGVTNPLVVVELGALLVDGTWPAEPWRLLTYGLLHHGGTHLVVNALAVASLGPVVSRLYGKAGVPALFLASSLLAGVGITFLGGHGVTLGASAGALGLLGAVAAATALHRHVRGSYTAATIGRLIAILVLVQAAFDIATPQISFAGHAFGVLSGGLVGVAWLKVRR